MTRSRRQFGTGLAALVALVALMSVSAAWACVNVNSPYLDAAEPNQGEAGAVVLISGGNWGEGSVDLQWRTGSNETISAFGSVAVDTEGHFSTQVTIPSSAAAGKYYVGAVQGEVSRATPFEVLAPTSDSDSGGDPSGQDPADESSDTSTDGDPDSSGSDPSGSTGDEPSGSTGDEPSGSSDPNDSNSTQTSGSNDPDGSGDNSQTASGSPDGDGSSDSDSQSSQTTSGGSEPSGSEQGQDDSAQTTDATGDGDAAASGNPGPQETADADSPRESDAPQPVAAAQPEQRSELGGSDPSARQQTSDVTAPQSSDTGSDDSQQPTVAPPADEQQQTQPDPTWRGLEAPEPTPGLGELGSDGPDRQSDDALAGLTVGVAALAIGLTLLAVGFGLADLNRRRRATAGDPGRRSGTDDPH